MKQFIGGILFGIGIGLLICGVVTGTVVNDFEQRLSKYDTHIDNFYEFTHSYGFETIRGLVDQTFSSYRANPLLRQALETFGLGELGQLFQDVDEKFEEIIDISEGLYDARSSVREARSWLVYLTVGGIVLIAAGVVVGVWASRQERY